MKTNPDGTCKGVGFVCFAPGPLFQTSLDTFGCFDFFSPRTQAEAEKAASEMNAACLERSSLRRDVQESPRQAKAKVLEDSWLSTAAHWARVFHAFSQLGCWIDGLRVV